MEHIIGGSVPKELFDRFLDDWRRVLEQRAADAIDACSQVDGVCGLVLAGSMGRSQQWPLSDIDFIPIYDDGRVEAAREEIERRRLELIERWLPEGWWTGVDVGRLSFTRDELAGAFPIDEATKSRLLADDRWYHSLDKGYGGRPVYDPHGLASQLVETFDTYRFVDMTVRVRLQRSYQEVEAARRQAAAEIDHQDSFEATRALHDAVKWLRAWLLEQWGESDTSLGRVGTRFERLARQRGCSDLVHELRALSGLKDESAAARMVVAPDWVHERHDRSWRARQAIGEELSQLDDARDVLRVSCQYEMNSEISAPYPEWLGIPNDASQMQALALRLNQVCEQWLPVEA